MIIHPKHVKVDTPLDTPFGPWAEGWARVTISEANGDAVMDAKGRVIQWRELNVTEGWGYIFDLDAAPEDQPRFVRVEAPWIRLLTIWADCPEPQPEPVAADVFFETVF